LQGIFDLQGRRVLSTLIMNVFTPALLLSKLGSSVDARQVSWPATTDSSMTHHGHPRQLKSLKQAASPTQPASHSCMHAVLRVATAQQQAQRLMVARMAIRWPHRAPYSTA